MGDGAQRRLRELLAERTGTCAEDWFCTLKARHAMLVAYRALRELRGPGAVATQLLTCCTAVNPIVCAGLDPLYLDVDPATVALGAASVAKAARSGATLRAVVDQHSYGIVDDAASARLRDAAHEAGALLVEDCAHAVARMARDALGAPLADVSVHSFGVEKLLPTYFGGAVWVSPELPDAGLRSALVSRLRALGEPAPALERAMRRYGTQIRVLNHLPGPARRAYRGLLGRRGGFEPAIARAELAGGVAHEPCLPGAWAAGQAAAALAGIDGGWAVRREAARAYAERLRPAAGALLLPAALTRADAPAQPLLRFPVFFEEAAAADEALAAVNAAGLYAVPWYRPTLYPGVSDPLVYGLDGAGRPARALPVTERLSRGPVALPCDVTPAQAKEVADIVLGRLAAFGAAR